MIRIAFCDDDPHFLPLLHQAVSQWFTRTQGTTAFCCEDFLSGAALLASLETGSFDLFFLDIEMPGMDGMEVAARIRQRLPDAILIFLTSHNEFAPDGYRVQALRYLCKLTWQAYLGEALEAATTQLDTHQAGCLSLLHYGNITRIPYRDILYVRHIGRYSHIVTKTGPLFQDDRGIKKLFAVLQDERFLFIDRGAFINLDYIKRLEKGQAVMMNGDTLAISRRLLPQVKLAINRYYGG